MPSGAESQGARLLRRAKHHGMMKVRPRVSKLESDIPRTRRLGPLPPWASTCIVAEFGEDAVPRLSFAPPTSGGLSQSPENARVHQSV